MFLIIAIGLSLIYALLKPLGDGLLDTSMWVAKILVPPDFEKGDMSKQMLKMGQAALMDGWLSNIPFFNTLVFFSAMIAGFMHSWWAGILLYFILAILGTVTKIVFGKSVSHYLPFLYHKMANRVADYKAMNDTDRLAASESYCEDLLEIMSLYKNSRMRPPTTKELEVMPYGDMYYWLRREADSA